MSKSPTAALALDDEIEPAPDAEVVLETPASLAEVEAKPAPTLITEQELVFGTAAAVRPRSTRWWTRAARVLAGTPTMSVTAEAGSRPKRRHYPSRLDFLEDSRMAREMYRGF